MKRSSRFERELPAGYRRVFYLNAKSLKVGIVFNLLALPVFAAVFFLGILVFIRVYADKPFSMGNAFWGLLGFYVALLLYVVLHELVHGLFYKLLTGEKLVFGISWSCAFCGVPQIYTYRTVTILSAAAPLVLFTLLFLPLCAVLLFVEPYLYFLALALFGLHLGGCVGDFYLVMLLLLRYKAPNVLVRDTGPEQSVYVYDPQNDANTKKGDIL